MRIGIIGSGEMGSLLASKFVALGHTVSITNSRGPQSMRQLAENIGVQPTTIEEVTKNRDVIVIAIPQKSILDLPRNIFNNLAKDIAIIDTGNYYPNLRDGILSGLDQSGIDSLWVQEMLGVTIVKAFNSILATSIKDVEELRDRNDRIALPVSGDNMGAKKTTFKLVQELGFDYLDIGNIHKSWKQQPGSTIYCKDVNLVTMKKKVEEMGDDWYQMQNIVLSKRSRDEKLMKADYTAYLETLKS